MKTLKQIEKIRRLHGLIKSESTGSPKQLSSNMGISERQLYLLLDYLREMDAPVQYSRRANTYYYAGAFDLLVHISVQVIQDDEIMNIYAGSWSSKLSKNLQGLCSEQLYLAQVRTELDVVG